jgi:hypothetical protein
LIITLSDYSTTKNPLNNSKPFELQVDIANPLQLQGRREYPCNFKD